MAQVLYCPIVWSLWNCGLWLRLSTVRDHAHSKSMSCGAGSCEFRLGRSGRLPVVVQSERRRASRRHRLLRQRPGAGDGALGALCVQGEQGTRSEQHCMKVLSLPEASLHLWVRTCPRCSECTMCQRCIGQRLVSILHEVFFVA